MRRWIVGGICFLQSIVAIIDMRTFEEMMIAIGLLIFSFIAAHIVFYPDHPFSKKVSDLF